MENVGIGMSEGDPGTKDRFVIGYLTIAVLLTVLTMSWLGWEAYRTIDATKIAAVKAARIEELHGIIVHLDEVLTMSARMAATTGHGKWEDRYRQFEPKLRQAIEEAQSIAPEAMSKEAAAVTEDANNVLVKLEYDAFRHVRQRRLDEARRVLFNNEYEDHKRIYAEGMIHFATGLTSLADEYFDNASKRVTVTLSMILIAIVALLAGWIVVLRNTSQWKAAIVEKAAALVELNANLDQKVQERTNRLQRVNEDLAIEIEARRRIEEQDRQHQLELAHATRLTIVGEMASGLSHELHQPLTSVMNYTNGCLRRLRNGDEGQEEIISAMEKAVKEAKRASDIMWRMRRFTRLGDVNVEPVDINEVVKEAMVLADPDYRKHDIRVHVELEEGLPSVMADRIQMEQVILNLLRNALEAVQKIDPDNPEVIVATALIDAGHVALTVLDRGCCLNEDEIDRAFYPFYTTKKDGMGLGLTISRSIIESFGGELTAKVVRHEGTLFQICLPLTASA
ncbi:MAG: hypothetical protein CMJ18_03055 [Phycisphaeraceae bacterium]|nr:hypothetical protein [Phycisphaeraceae bacterium]